MADPKLDLLIIDTHNTYSLGIGDISTYVGTPVNPTIQLTPPGFNTVTLSFTPNNINIYDSENLGLCVASQVENTPIPDGVYKIRYTIHPAHKYYVEKTFMKVDQILEKFDIAFLKTDIVNCDIDLKEKDAKLLREINFDIQGAIAAANSCAIKLANQLYSRANTRLDKFLEQRCYTC